MNPLAIAFIILFVIGDAILVLWLLKKFRK
jgi:hypothetical protein